MLLLKLAQLKMVCYLLLLLPIIFCLLFTLCFGATSQDITPIHPPQQVSGMDSEITEENHRDTKKIIVISVVVASAVVGGVLLFLWCFCVFRLKRLKKKNAGEKQPQLDVANRRPMVPILSKLNSLRMGGKKANVAVLEYSLLVEATNGFEESSKVGDEGLGCVYKANLGENFVAAVKMLTGSGGGADREFQNEIGWLSKMQHQNIVTLLGCCLHENTKFLVYEMMPNGSLESQLHGPSCGAALDWSTRMKIALDIARGLEYLHEHCDPAVIHRNINSSNILLDSNFNAKLSGFRLAVTVSSPNKNDLKVPETLGYLAPEYLLNGKQTEKSDVYAFGVVLLELLTGRKPMEKMSPDHHQSIVTWAMPQFTDRSKLPNIVDPVLKDKMDVKHLYQVAAVAVLCVQPEPSYRPLITDVLHSLIPLVPVELGGSLRIVESSQH